MNLTDALLPVSLWWLWLILALVLGSAVWQAPWRMLAKPGILNLILAACVLVLFYWQVKAGIRPGLNLHLLGGTLLTLLFGPWFALLSIMLVLLLTTFWNGDWYAFAVNWLLMGVVPVGVSWLIYRLADSRLPNNLFVYVFINAFIGAALAMVATGLAICIFLTAIGAYSWHDLAQSYLPYFILMAWSEAVTTGMMLTLMVVYKPHWVATFDDKHYINNQ